MERFQSKKSGSAITYSATSRTALGAAAPSGVDMTSGAAGRRETNAPQANAPKDNPGIWRSFFELSTTFIHELVHFVSLEDESLVGFPIGDHPKAEDEEGNEVARDPVKGTRPNPYDLDAIQYEALSTQFANAHNYTALIFNLWLNGDEFSWPRDARTGKYLTADTWYFPAIFRTGDTQDLEKCYLIPNRVERVRGAGAHIQYNIIWDGYPYVTWESQADVNKCSGLKEKVDAYNRARS